MVKLIDNDIKNIEKKNGLKGLIENYSYFNFVFWLPITFLCIMFISRLIIGLNSTGLININGGYNIFYFIWDLVFIGLMIYMFISSRKYKKYILNNYKKKW